MSPYDEDKSFLQEFFWAALDRHRERGHNEKLYVQIHISM